MLKLCIVKEKTLRSSSDIREQVKPVGLPVYRSVQDVKRVGLRAAKNRDAIDNYRHLNQFILPESLARTHQFKFLSAGQKDLLNHIRGHAFFHIIALVDTHFLAGVLDFSMQLLEIGDFRIEVLSRFKRDLAKNHYAFKKLSAGIERLLGFSCHVYRPEKVVTDGSYHPLAIAIAALRLEWMIQYHYTESSLASRNLFGCLFGNNNGTDNGTDNYLVIHDRFHGCANADALTQIVEIISEGMSQQSIDQTVSDYLNLGGLLEYWLMQQIDRDIDTMQQAIGRNFSKGERDHFVGVQGQAMRWMFLGSGHPHPSFQSLMKRISPNCYARVEHMKPGFNV